MRQQDLEQRALLEELLRRARAWLSISPPERRTVRKLVEQMRYPRTVGEQLLTAYDLAQLAAFLDRYAAANATRVEPDRRFSWANPETQVAYRVIARDVPRSCAYLSITADLTGVVHADLGDMTNTVKASYCRTDDGAWKYKRQ